jgi:hypothetical protein
VNARDIPIDPVSDVVGGDILEEDRVLIALEIIGQPRLTFAHRWKRIVQLVIAEVSLLTAQMIRNGSDENLASCWASKSAHSSAVAASAGRSRDIPGSR